jgi:hypothetical protein
MGRLRLLVVLGLCAVLGWLVVTRGLAFSLVETDPESALILQPSEPRALLTLAREKLDQIVRAKTNPDKAEAKPTVPNRQAPDDELHSSDRILDIARLAGRTLLVPQGDVTPPDASTRTADPSATRDTEPNLPSWGEVATLAQRVIALDPWNADALAILAQVREQENDASKTAALMSAAARLSIRESYAVFWLLQQALAKNDKTAALYYADALLRTRGGAMVVTAPILAQMAEKEKAAEDVAALLAQNPPWRQQFLATLPTVMSDARTPLYLLQALATSPTPPTTPEVSGYLSFLISRGFFELAYYTWLQFQPKSELSRIRPLYNAGFDRPPSGYPFDWTLRQGRGVTSEIRPIGGTSDEKALYIEFTQGRAEFPGVSQVTLLAPGTYELSGQLKGAFVGARGLVWRVTCTNGTVLGQSDLLRGNFPQWRAFSFTFTVPQNACRAQTVRLDLDARSASEKLVAGSLWFDQLDVKRQPN